MSCILISEEARAAAHAQLPAQAVRLTHRATAHIAAGQMHDARDYMVEAQRCMDRFLSQSSSPNSSPAETIPAEQDVVLADRSAGSNHRDDREVAA